MSDILRTAMESAPRTVKDAGWRWVRAARKHAGLTMGDMARHLGVSVSRVSDLELGYAPADERMLELIFCALSSGLKASGRLAADGTFTVMDWRREHIAVCSRQRGATFTIGERSLTICAGFEENADGTISRCKACGAEWRA